MPINENTFNNLSNNQIWFSSPLDFNDPYDFFVPFDDTFTDEGFRQKVPLQNGYTYEQYEQMLQFYKQNPKEFKYWSEKGLRRYLAKVRVACFCEEKTEILMWSHYSDYHRGICLKFDSLLDKHFFYEEDWENHKMIIKKVNYPKDFEKIWRLSVNDNDFEKQAYTKYHKWAYEKEHRIISAVDVVKFNKKSLIEVNFGCKLNRDDSNVQNIIKLVKSCNYPNVKFIKADKCTDKYELKFKEIKF